MITLLLLLLLLLLIHLLLLLNRKMAITITIQIILVTTTTATTRNISMTHIPSFQHPDLTPSEFTPLHRQQQERSPTEPDDGARLAIRYKFKMRPHRDLKRREQSVKMGRICTYIYINNSGHDAWEAAYVIRVLRHILFPIVVSLTWGGRGRWGEGRGWRWVLRV